MCNKSLCHSLPYYTGRTERRFLFSLARSLKFISTNLKQKEYSSPGRKAKRSQKSTQAINHQSHHQCWESGTEEHNCKNMHINLSSSVQPNRGLQLGFYYNSLKKRETRKLLSGIFLQEFTAPDSMSQDSQFLTTPTTAENYASGLFR